MLAAHRAEIRTVILPKRNEQDLEEVPEGVRSELGFVLVESVEEVQPGPVLDILPLRMEQVQRSEKGQPAA